MPNEIRKDPKGRKLKTGETYDPVKGRYRYSYVDASGSRRQLYSWTLTKNDPIPKGKGQKYGESLREKEAKAQAEIANAIDTEGGNMSVIHLLEKYAALKSKDVRETTRKGYRTQIQFMKTNSTAKTMAKKRIKMVGAMEAEEWVMKLHKKEQRSYSSLHTLKGMLRQEFIHAKKNRWVVDNPFDFSMAKKAYGGTKMRDALSRDDMRRFLNYVMNHTVYSNRPRHRTAVRRFQRSAPRG